MDVLNTYEKMPQEHDQVLKAGLCHPQLSLIVAL